MCVTTGFLPAGIVYIVEMSMLPNTVRNRSGTHHQHVHVSSLLAQCLTLFDSEAVLFVYDHQRQLPESHILREQGMSPDCQVYAAVFQRLQEVAPFLSLHVTCKEGDIDAQSGQQSGRPFRMLTCEQLSGCHEGDLSAFRDLMQCADPGDQCLSRTHIALQEAVHVTAVKIPADLIQTLLLVGCQAEAEAGYQAPLKLADRCRAFL